MSEVATKASAGRVRRPWRVAVVALEILVLVGLLTTLWHRRETRRAWRAALAAVEEHLGPSIPGQYVMPSVAGYRNGFTWLTAGSAALHSDDGFEELRALAEQPRDRWAPEERIAELMERNQPALELLHDAAARPDLGLAIEYGRGYELEMPNLVAYNRAARVLAGHARWSLTHGDREAALASIRSLALMARGLEQEPVLIAKLIGAAVERRLHLVVGEWVASPSPRSPSPQDLSELELLLAELPEPIDYPRGLGLEAASILRAIADESDVGLSPWRFRLFGHLCASEIAARYAEVGRRSSEPFARVRSELWSEEGVIGSAERRQSWVGRLCEPEVRVYSIGPDALLRLELTESGRRLLRTGLELATIAARAGEYPTTLEAVGSAAVEPAAGEMPAYERRADGSVAIAYPAADRLTAEFRSAHWAAQAGLRLVLPAPSTPD